MSIDTRRFRKDFNKFKGQKQQLVSQLKVHILSLTRKKVLIESKLTGVPLLTVNSVEIPNNASKEIDRVRNIFSRIVTKMMTKIIH